MKTEDATWGDINPGDVIIEAGYEWDVLSVQRRESNSWDRYQGTRITASCKLTNSPRNDNLQNTGYRTSNLGAFDWVEVLRVIK